MMAGARRDLDGENHPPIQAQGNYPYHCQERASPHMQKARRELQIISTEILSTPVEISSYRKLKKFSRSQHKTPGWILLPPSPQSPSHTQVPRVVCPLLTSSE